MDALITEVLSQVRGIAQDVLQREGTRLRTATVESVDPLRIRYDGEAEPSVVPPRRAAVVSQWDRVVVAKTRGQATILGVLGAATWQAITPTAPWEPYGGGGNYLEGIRARRVEAGVQVHAMIRAGTAGTTMFTLPSDLQPQHAHQVGATANGSEHAVVYFHAGGVVELLSGPATVNYLNITALLPD